MSAFLVTLALPGRTERARVTADSAAAALTQALSTLNESDSRLVVVSVKRVP